MSRRGLLRACSTDWAALCRKVTCNFTQSHVTTIAADTGNLSVWLVNHRNGAVRTDDDNTDGAMMTEEERRDSEGTELVTSGKEAAMADMSPRCKVYAATNVDEEDNLYEPAGQSERRRRNI